MGRIWLTVGSTAAGAIPAPVLSSWSSAWRMLLPLPPELELLELDDEELELLDEPPSQTVLFTSGISDKPPFWYPENRIPRIARLNRTVPTDVLGRVGGAA